LFNVNLNWDERDEGYYYIANHSFRGGFMVSLKDDKIYFDNQIDIKFMANNIYELISTGKVVKNNIEYSQYDNDRIVKNLSENYWKYLNS
jgi:hypothetical protein